MFEASSHLAASRFFDGNDVPVHDELDVVDLAVRGKLPDDLAGVYMRNGPNPKYEPIAYTYPFDGDGMLHAVYFDKGKARYRNRFVQTAGLAVEDRAGRAVYGSVIAPTPVDRSLLRPGDPPLLKNVANINIIEHGGHYLALYESEPPHEVTRELDTVGPFDFAGALTMGMTAHPRKDLDTGELHFFTYAFAPPYLTYYVADRQGKVVTEQPIDLPNATMIHDFVITARHVLFFDCPVVFDFGLVEKGESPLQWRPELGTRIVALDRHDPAAKPVVVEDEPFFVYHFVNAYDRGGQEIVVDYVRHRLLSFGPGEQDSSPTMHRMVVDLSIGKASDKPVDGPVRSVEFPRVDDRRTGREHRYGYAAADSREGGSEDEFDSLTQYDYQRGTVKLHKPGPGRSPGEACFVPRPGSTKEDDGYVVSFVYGQATDRSELVLIDAADFDAEPVAAIELPARVPSGLHGNWMPLDE